jgi:hypothetical protein
MTENTTTLVPFKNAGSGGIEEAVVGWLFVLQ